MKFGNHVEKVFTYFYLGGDETFFWKGEKMKFFDVSNLRGKLVCIFVIYYLSVFLSLFSHMH